MSVTLVISAEAQVDTLKFRKHLIIYFRTKLRRDLLNHTTDTKS